MTRYAMTAVCRSSAVALVSLCLIAISAATRSVGADNRLPTTAPFSIEEASIAAIQKAILNKEVTTRGIVELYLARIKAYNGTCVSQPEGLLGPVTPIAHAGQLNALGTLNLRPAARRAWGFDDHKARSMTDAADTNPAMPDALETAARQDAELGRTGRLVGPLHGVVMSIKDQFDTFDMRTTNGADVAYANDRPPHDSTPVERLRQAGAIILAKANRGGFNSRSAFGGTVCNAYDTARTPRGSSSGSAVGVAANLTTCSIGEETGTSIRLPSAMSNVVGLSPTQELISRGGMSGPGINVRSGPICRTVADTAKVLQAFVGYDPRDPHTAFSVGRLAPEPLDTYAVVSNLAGLRIGVLREFMDVRLYTKRDEEAIGVVDRAVSDLKKTGATIVDPGAGGALFTDCFKQYVPQAFGKLFTRMHPELFPVDDQGKPTSDHIAKLVELKAHPERVPLTISIREFYQPNPIGDSAFWRELYVQQRNDPAIKTASQLAAATKPINDPVLAASSPNISVATPYGSPRTPAPEPKQLDTADRMLQRWAMQQVILACMADQNLDAMVYPTNNIPAQIIQAPEEPAINGRDQSHWVVFGRNGFPTITVPGGFTQEVYDRVPDAASADRTGTRLVGPVAARLPIGVDFAARPFGEPTLLRIAAAYEAATKHREVPADFKSVPAR